MYSPKTEEGPFKRFMKTMWFRVLYIVLLSLASAVILFGAGCLSLLVVPLILFAVPYWLKERRVKNYLVNGLMVFILTFLMFNTIYTQYIVTSPKPDVSAESGTIILSHGTVTPYAGGSGSYNFSVSYTSTSPVNASSVMLRMTVYDYRAQNSKEYSMDGDTTGLVTQGWTYWKDLSLDEGIYSFNFTAITDTTTGKSVISTISRLGPINAPWTTYFYFLSTPVLLDVSLALFMYGIIVGLFWWSQRMKQIRGPMFPPAKSGTRGNFECTNCGADVSEDAVRCPRCGAVFEDEPVVRAQKIEKEKHSGPETESEDKKGKKKS